MGIAALEEALGAARANYLAVSAAIGFGTDVTEALAAGRPAETRHGLTMALDTFEQLRRRSRLALIAVALDQGTSINDISRTWGISRQLASRYAHEARHGR